MELSVRALNRYRNWRRRKAAKRLIANGDAARDAGKWRVAAEAYAEALHLDAGLAPIHVQHGHALKEAGDWEGARAAYERALGIDPQSSDAWLQLGHVLKLLGRSEEAIAAYRQACSIATDTSPALRELIAMGARHAVPDEAVRAASDAAAYTMNEAVRALHRAVDAMRELSSWPSLRYDDFRHAHPVLPPPKGIEDACEPISILVDGRSASAAVIRCTLDSLLDQTCRTWRAIILVDDAMAGHPVASMAEVDRRISFVVEASQALPTGSCLCLRAGTMLNSCALEWFRFAATLTSADAAYCDHDHARQDWRGNFKYFDPVLQPRFDPSWFGAGHSSPALVYIAQARLEAVEWDGNNADLLRRISSDGRIVHVPRVLATIVDVAATVATAPPDVEVKAPGAIPAACSPHKQKAADNAVILVVIPTRDQADLLERCVHTLIARARFPERLRIVVVDNRSVEDGTAILLARLTATHGVKVLPLDEPFNWSRANNSAIEQSDASLVVLLNNDTEMLSQDWDQILAGHLADPDVGIVGAKLLYPDRTVQHAGILFGMNDAPPTHEGVGATEDDPGPDGRWVRLRYAAAVTGAFMAMRRGTWEKAGGFDELAFPLGYNDVDMCLRVRATGAHILFAPDLLLIHHESKTRGHNVTRSQVAWDLAELRALYRRWGDLLFEDPSLNPHWTRHGLAFSGYREPAMSEIVRYMGS